MHYMSINKIATMTSSLPARFSKVVTMLVGRPRTQWEELAAQDCKVTHLT